MLACGLKRGCVQIAYLRHLDVGSEEKHYRSRSVLPQHIQSCAHSVMQIEVGQVGRVEAALQLGWLHTLGSRLEDRTRMLTSSYLPWVDGTFSRGFRHIAFAH
jgi:hypothetical protein